MQQLKQLSNKFDMKDLEQQRESLLWRIYQERKVGKLLLPKQAC